MRRQTLQLLPSTAIISRRRKEARNIAKVATRAPTRHPGALPPARRQIRCLAQISRRPAGDPATCAGGMNTLPWPAAWREVASCVSPRPHPPGGRCRLPAAWDHPEGFSATSPSRWQATAGQAAHEEPLAPAVPNSRPTQPASALAPVINQLKRHSSMIRASTAPSRSSGFP